MAEDGAEAARVTSLLTRALVHLRELMPPELLASQQELSESSEVWGLVRAHGAEGGKQGTGRRMRMDIRGMKGWQMQREQMGERGGRGDEETWARVMVSALDVREGKLDERERRLGNQERLVAAREASVRCCI